LQRCKLNNTDETLLPLGLEYPGKAVSILKYSSLCEKDRFLNKRRLIPNQFRKD